MEHEHETSKNRVLATIILNTSITAFEIIGGIFSRSTALLSDALHNLSDTVAGVLTYSTMRISERKANRKFTFGYKRTEILSAFINSSVLLVIAALLMKEGMQKLFHPSDIKTNIMLVVSVIGLLANGAAVILLSRHSKENINIKSAYVHLFGDTISSVGVVLSAIIMHFFGLRILDPIMTILISVYMLFEGFKIIKESSEILLECSPNNVDIMEIEKELLNINGIKNVHHVHLWRLNDKELLFEAHINVDNINISDSKKIRNEAEKILEDKFNIFHSTIQFEHNEHLDERLLHR
ncbi:MAG: cation transporter [Candidatus Methanofastidiosa archaeon]|nr:cation transporter [Candidatus Methanofastidiosa archaeon]